MFIPGETVTQTIYVPFLSSEIQRVKVSYEQFDRVILTKEIIGGFTDATNRTASCYFTINLTQSDTLLFFDETPYSIQINVLLNNGTMRCTSQEIKSFAGKQHIREIYS